MSQDEPLRADTPWDAASAPKLRTWQGMPPRCVWNASPGTRGLPICPTCGYRWHARDFVDHRCWNCWRVETQPDAVRKEWVRLDSLREPESGQGAMPEMKKLGGEGPR